MKYSIRTSTHFDIPLISALLELAFEGDAERKLVDSLRLCDEYIAELSFVLEIENTIIGYLLFTRIYVENQLSSTNLLALAPMAILPSHQGKGLGSALVEHGLDIAHQMDFHGVAVLGHEKYYPRFGFKPASQWQITCPWPVPDEVFMFLDFGGKRLTKTSGQVKYAPPFYAL